MYHFRVPSSIFRRRNNAVEVRLNAERGDFAYAVLANKKPTQDDVNKKVKNLFMGGEYRNVEIRRPNLDGNTLRKHMIDFYVKVVPINYK
jgi:hypothetical protein